MFEAFGRVISCSLVRDVSNPETHTGYGFIEFETPEAMEEAIKMMDRYDLGGKPIRCGPCVTPPSLQNITTSNHGTVKDEDKMKPARMLSDMIKRAEAALENGGNANAIDFEQPKQLTDSKRGSAAAEKGVPLSSINDAEGDVSLTGIEQRNMLMNKLSRAPQTRVLCLRNMLQSTELDGEVEAEVTEECENYGRVTKVVIYQERQSAAPDAEVVVKIFVQFGTPHEVQTAISALDKRFFNGNLVSAEIYDQTSFDMKDYTG